MNTKTSLHHIDIIMSYRGNTPERENNLYAVLRHFDCAHTDYKVWLVEADSSPKFNWNLLADPKIQHLFIHNSGPFPKALLYNTGAKISNSSVLFFIDIDCIPHPKVLSDCIYNILTTTQNDVLCPYHGAINVAGETKRRFIENPDFSIFNGLSKTSLTEDTNLLYEGSMGGAFIIRRKDFVRIGGLDTSFIGWGGEDNELFYRSQRLGIRWTSMNTPIFHLNHDSTTREGWSEKAEYNSRKAYLSHTMPMSELEAHTEKLKVFFI